MRGTAQSNTEILGEADSDSDDSSRSLDDQSDSGSEEDAWQGGPRRASLTRREELLRQKRAAKEAKEVAERIRLGGQSEAHIGNRAMVPRRHRLKPFVTQSALSSEAKAEARRAEADFDQVQILLDSMRIKLEADEAEERRQFEARNKALWDRVDAGIREEEEKRAREEQARMQRAKEQREAEERRQKEAKEAQEAKAREEREREEKVKREEEERLAEARAEQERIKQEEKSKGAGGVGVSLDREARDAFDVWTAKMAHIKSNVLPVVAQNAAWRKQCFTAKRSLTRGVSQLTNSREEIIRIVGSAVL